jgi:hypothetical protein
MASSLDISTDVALVDTRLAVGSIQLPLTTTIPYRVFIIKDAYGSFGSNSLTVTTQDIDTFEDGSTSKVFSDNFSYISLYGNTQNRVWQILGATQYNTLTVSSIVGVSTIRAGYFIGDGSFLSNIGGGVSSLSSIVSYGLSTVAAGAVNPGVSSLSSIVSYGLSTVYSPYGISSLSSIVSYGLSTVYSPYGISSLSSIVSYGLSTVYSPYGISSLSSIVSYGLSSLTLIPDVGLSTLSSIVSYGISSFSTSIGQVFIGSSIIGSNIQTTLGTISSLTLSTITFGSGAGFVTFGAIQAVAASTMQTNAGVLQATNATITSISSINIQTSNIAASNIIANIIYGPGLTNAIIMNCNAFGGTAVAVYTSSIVASGYLSFNALGYQGQPQNLFNTNLVTSLTGMYLYGSDSGNVLYYNFSPSSALLPSYANLAGGQAVSAIANNGNIIIVSRPNNVNPFTYSYDGLNFYPGVASINASGTMTSIVYNGSNLWAASGGQQAIYTSVNGINWSVNSTPIFAVAITNGLAYNGSNLWVAGSGAANSNTMGWSSNGTTWNAAISGGFCNGFCGQGTSIGWNGSIWVALGSSTVNQSNAIIYSGDGKNWSNTTFVPAGFSGKTVVWAGAPLSIWVGGGSGLGNIASNALVWSTDGLTWNSANNGFAPNAVNTIIWNGTQFIAGGASTSTGILQTSTDGKNWTQTSIVAPTGIIKAISWFSTMNTNISISSINSPNAVLTTISNTTLNTATVNASAIINANAFSTGTFITNIISTNAIYTSSILIGASDSILDITGPARATTFSTFYIDTSTINSFTMSAQMLTTSSITTLSNIPVSIPVPISTPSVLVSSIQMGSYGNIIDVTGPLRFTTGSTINFYASSIQANGLQLGSTSNTVIAFAGLSNTYDRTVITEQSNSATSQEILLFKGNTTLDNIRLQTTGNVLIESQVASRVWPTNTQGTFQSFFISGQGGAQSAQVGINTNIATIPAGITLDVANATGTATVRAPIVSTTKIFTSSIAGATLFPVYWNTVVASNSCGTTLTLTTSNLGSYVFITTTAGTGSNVTVVFPTVSVPNGAFFVVNHKGASALSNNIVLSNTAYNIPISTSKTSVYTGVEWVTI